MYIGISPSKFDELVAAGTMPTPVKIGGRKVWDRHELDLAFDALPREDAPEAGASYDSWVAKHADKTEGH
jgi:hypothetical protein